MANGWMIRAGTGGKLIEDFEAGYIAIGWNEVGDLSNLSVAEDLRSAFIACYGNTKPSRTANSIAMLRKFRFDIRKGDTVISYSPERREYLVGEDLGNYKFMPEDKQVGGFSNTRSVKWLGTVSRDALPVSTRNSLGSTLTLFALSETVLRDIQVAMSGKPVEPPVPDIIENISDSKDKVVSEAHELIKDKILALQADEMEELVAAILRAMGYKTKVSPKGPDRGVDITASPDGLGLTQPRIKVEVKHR